MGRPVDDVLRLLVEHVDLGGVLGVVLDLVLDQVGRQVGELDGLSIGLVRAVEKINKLLDEVFATRKLTVADHLLHDVDELFKIELLARVLIKLLSDVEQLH